MPEVAAWTLKPVNDIFVSRHVHPKYLIRFFFFFLIWKLFNAQLWGENTVLTTTSAAEGCARGGLPPSPRSTGGCFRLCVPRVGCCCHIPVVLREVPPRRHRGRLLSHRPWREIGAVAVSCHPQFHMSVFLLTFSNNTENMWLTSEITHLFLAAKTRPRVTYCKTLFPPDSDPYWSLLKSCVQFFHNCPYSNHGRQPIKH